MSKKSSAPPLPSGLRSSSLRKSDIFFHPHTGRVVVESQRSESNDDCDWVALGSARWSPSTKTMPGGLHFARSGDDDTVVHVVSDTSQSPGSVFRITDTHLQNVTENGHIAKESVGEFIRARLSLLGKLPTTVPRPAALSPFDVVKHLLGTLDVHKTEFLNAVRECITADQPSAYSIDAILSHDINRFKSENLKGRIALKPLDYDSIVLIRDTAGKERVVVYTAPKRRYGRRITTVPSRTYTFNLGSTVPIPVFSLSDGNQHLDAKVTAISVSAGMSTRIIDPPDTYDPSKQKRRRPHPLNEIATIIGHISDTAAYATERKLEKEEEKEESGEEDDESEDGEEGEE